MTVTKRYYLKAFAFIFVGTGLFHVALAVFRAWRTDWQSPVDIHVTNIAVSTLIGVGLVHCVQAGYVRWTWISGKRQALKSAARECARFVVGHPVLFIALALAALWGQSVPPADSLGPAAKAIYDIVRLFGTGCFVVWLVLQTGSAMTSVAQVSALAVAAIERFVLLLASLIAIRAFGPELADVISVVKPNPDASLATVIGVLVVYCVFALAPHRSQFVAGEGAFGLSIRRIPRQASDIKRTAVHEAGHLLLFAALPCLPSELSVTVMREIGPLDDYRGRVTSSPLIEPEVRTEMDLRWDMLMRLSGGAAEAFVYGERADGSTGDTQAWLQVAVHFLTSGLGEVFYVTAVDDSRLAHNRVVLNTLKGSQLEALEGFFAANRSLLSELAALIADRSVLNREDIQPFLERVTFTEGVPRLMDPASGTA